MSFSLTRALPEDLPGMVDIWYNSFNTPSVLTLFPDTTTVREWLSNCFAEQLKDETTTHMIVTKDSSGPNERPRPVALAIYRRHDGGPLEKNWHIRWSPPIVEGMSEETLGPSFFDAMMRQHIIAMEERPHYFLEVLCCHEEFQKKGLGSMLLEWGCQTADQEGFEMYLDAAKKAQPLYEKYGYVEQEYRDPKASSAPMRRLAKK